MDNPLEVPHYLKKYGLVEAPYNTNADERFLYLNSGSHLEAINMVSNIIFNKQAGGLIVGDQGTGKTSILRRIATLLSSTEVYNVGVILTAGNFSSPFQFIKAVLEAFGQECIGRDLGARTNQLEVFLISEKGKGKVSVLLIDECHQLNKKMFETIRGFTNLEHPELGKVVHIFLFGQLEITPKIRRTALRTRLYRTLLTMMSQEEIESMLRWRFVQAGGKGFPFTLEAVQRIHDYSKGNPRVTCAIAQLALQSNPMTEITAEIIDQMSGSIIL